MRPQERLRRLRDGQRQLEASARAHRLGGDRADGIACLASAGDDCDAAERCLNGGQPAASCGDGSTSITSSCAGDELAACYQAMTVAFDCSSVGLLCVTSTTGYGGCGHGSCSSDFVACVDGTTLASCNSGIETRQDCSVDGLGCVSDGTSGRCGGSGAACEPGLPTCDGDVLVSCDGHQSRLDCTTQGLRCIVPASGSAACASADACDVTATPTCDAASGQLHYCYFGTALVADCRGDGFSGCDATGCVR